MLLAVDIGNTNIVIGGLEGREVLFTHRLTTDRMLDGRTCAAAITAVLEQQHAVPEGGILASVVPPVTEAVREGMRLVLGKEPLVVSPSMETGLRIDMDNVSRVGSDRIVIAVAALERYQPPLILLDLGTATTIEVVDRCCTYVGGCIIPGVATAVHALSRRAAQLPDIELTAPVRVIGRNTVECMQSGAMYGTAAMLDGMIARMEEELGERATVLATGGIAPAIVPLCCTEMVLEEDLMLQGLRRLYEMNVN